MDYLFAPLIITLFQLAGGLPFPGPGNTFSSGSGGGVTFVQAPAAFCSGTSTGVTTETWSITPTAGNIIVGTIGYFNQAQTPATIKLSDGTTNCTLGSGGQDSSTINSMWNFYCPTIPSSITGVVVTQSNGSYPCVGGIEVSGLNASPVDASGVPPNSSGGALNWSAPTMTPTGSLNEIILSGIYVGSAFTGLSGTNCTIVGTTSGTISMAQCYTIVSSTAGSYTLSGNDTHVFNTAIGSTYKH